MYILCAIIATCSIISVAVGVVQFFSFQWSGSMFLYILLGIVGIVISVLMHSYESDKRAQLQKAEEKKQMLEAEFRRNQAQPAKVQATFDLPELYDYELKYRYEDVFIAGAKYYDCSGATVGMPVELRSEPENEHDSKAVAVYQHGCKLGFIQKGKLQDMYRDFIIRGGCVRAVLTSISVDALEMLVGFYCEKLSPLEEYEANGTKGRTFKLTANKNDEMQSNIGLVSVGDEVFAEYDFDKEKHLAVFDSLEIGYFPKSANELLEESACAYVSEVGEDDNGYHTISVKVFAHS